jgi:OmpA-OmpF porin, OOP family
MSGKAISWTIAVPISLVLTTTGCATKKFVQTQVNSVNHKVSQLQTKTNEEMAYLTNKQATDMSQVNERIAATDQRLSEVASTAEQAQGTASRAMESTQTNKDLIAGNTAAINTLQSSVADALNYQLVQKTDVMFAFNKSTLTPAAKSELDQIAAKAQSMPRTVIELAGFTDRIGSRAYNLALSRRRAEAVQRYLVQQKVPLRNIHIVGLGEEAPPENLAIEPSTSNGKPAGRELNRLARRVRISVYGAGDIAQGTASRSQQ